MDRLSCQGTNTIEKDGYHLIETQQIYKYTDFKTFEKECDDEIWYASMNLEDVETALDEESEDGTDWWAIVDIVYFDGWYVALKNY